MTKVRVVSCEGSAQFPRGVLFSAVRRRGAVRYQRWNTSRGTSHFMRLHGPQELGERVDVAQEHRDRQYAEDTKEIDECK